ncbi:MAG: RNA pyrophosphohydrolase [Planktomarina sp.]|jgi:putative (di)nucleoside polyphosphate hydrolase|nr:RNA pyrophosphohydrolase [Planktomarina sp.]MDT2032500.1 RNA pyrophosphohydrolase [Planktomarina sp.]MDT2039018.1 RNA pyrophosphohydrolase [Planktomarina sp.]|tara:strand:- start:3673 stop:4137 length:465 start_codon:yes stop_codon:yes gene_type:complete
MKLPYRANVGIMVINQEGLVFVAQRLDHYSDAWQMPQGGVDPGEDTQTAAIRELEEETGIPANKVNIIAESSDWIPYELPPDLIPKLWDGKYRGQKQKWYLMKFLGEDTDINIDTSEPEFSTWKWIDPKELPNAIVPFKRDVYVRVLEEFQDFL